ncbi:acyl-CoA thioesterase domain-containing protein [Nocardia pseudobrasiliensis]|uniref:Thioesterase superfamily protein n=1 Tax=Nocardia pseudobrasiliensis TaxID=45979 RepID=A0A370HQE6_9NOCA|nr:acyl-CoA thioesterase domain-containing protein [Nocardia pseudobrasiliensis]RDI60530.1 thioesterase superfamily protein [Nocardia pseudobrasiliensis]
MAIFAEHEGGFEPLPFAGGQWAAGTVNGSALAGLAANALETAHGEPGFRVARFTMDIFRLPTFAPLHLDTTLVRAGRSVRIADVAVRQGDRPIARASMVCARASRDPDGTRWQPHRAPMALPERLAGSDLVDPVVCWGSDAHPDGWSETMSEHQNSSRKRLWFNQPRLLAARDNSPFVRAAMVGEMTNTLTSWGDRGIAYINHDVTVVLTRLPIGTVVGIEAENHLAADGVAAGVATMWDRAGCFGISTVSSMALGTGALDVARNPHDWEKTEEMSTQW